MLADIQNLSRNYASGNEALAKAQGRLEGLRDSAAHGGPALEAKDDPTLADMEQRVSALREQLRELQRKTTPPNTWKTQTRMPRRLEAVAWLRWNSNSRRSRAARQKTILPATARTRNTRPSRGAVDRMHRDLAENQIKARAFAARLADFKVLQDDLDHLQTLERAATDRLTKSSKPSERERAPKVEILRLRPCQGLTPWKPDYGLQAGHRIGGFVSAWSAGGLV